MLCAIVDYKMLYLTIDQGNVHEKRLAFKRKEGCDKSETLTLKCIEKLQLARGADNPKFWCLKDFLTDFKGCKRSFFRFLMIFLLF